MQTSSYYVETERYAKCIEISKRVRWDIDQDVIRGRKFDFSKKFLPDGISKIHQLDFLNNDEKRFLSQVQGRTYANMFRLVERFIVAKILEVSRNHWLRDQIALEALVRFCDEELKHQELFRRVETMIAPGMPAGYTFLPGSDAVAADVLTKSTWAVLGLIYEIELFTQAHYKESIEPDENLDELYKDLFLFHWKEEVTHALMDAIEWPLEDQKLTPEKRDQAVDELIELVTAVDGLLQEQVKVDADYFRKSCGRSLRKEEMARLKITLLEAYRWQYIFSGVDHKHFRELLRDMTSEAQYRRIDASLGSIR